PAASVRRTARELLGRDSESLNERFFHRILRDAHDAERIDLRHHGEEYEVAPGSARAAAAAPAKPAATAASADVAADASQAQRSAANAASLRRGMRHRGLRTSRGGELPPDLLSVGVVGLTPTTPVAEPEPVSISEPVTEAEPATAEAPAPRSRGRRGGKSSARGRTSKATAAAAAASEAPAAKPRRPRGGGRASAAVRGRRGMTENAARTARRSRIAARQRPLPRSFYDRDTELVARELLGAILWCASPDG